MQPIARNLQIVGENSVMNALLAAFLKDAVQAECRYCAKLEDAIRKRGDEAEKQLVLIDCYGMQKDAIISLVESAPLRKAAGCRPTLLNLHPESGVEQAAIGSGVRGFFYLDDPLDSLAKGILALFEDEYWISRKLLVDFLATPNHPVNFACMHPELTLRESELIGLLTKGLSNQAIADLLFISIPTVKSHLSSIYRKIKVSNRLQAVRWAERATTNHPPD
jgi:LuxR family transcriptional regulator, positive regulator of biofilm formation